MLFRLYCSEKISLVPFCQRLKENKKRKRARVRQRERKRERTNVKIFFENIYVPWNGSIVGYVKGRDIPRASSGCEQGNIFSRIRISHNNMEMKAV